MSLLGPLLPSTCTCQLPGAPSLSSPAAFTIDLFLSFVPDPPHLAVSRGPSQSTPHEQLEQASPSQNLSGPCQGWLVATNFTRASRTWERLPNSTWNTLAELRSRKRGSSYCHLEMKID